LTEEEAKKKWCVQAQATDNPAKCDGSACMAWRWELDAWELDFDDNGPFLIRKTKETHGHCGMAGKP
jgi:hypothetical protein